MRISIEAGTIDSENRKVIEENRSRQCRENFFSLRKKPLFLFLPFSFLLLIDAIPRFIDISRVAGIIEQALSKRGNTILRIRAARNEFPSAVPIYSELDTTEKWEKAKGCTETRSLCRILEIWSRD